MVATHASCFVSGRHVLHQLSTKLMEIYDNSNSGALGSA